MSDYILQNLPAGSIVLRHTGELIRIEDGPYLRQARCIKKGSASNWYEGRVVPLPELESSKYEVYQQADPLRGSVSSRFSPNYASDTNPNPNVNLTAIAKRLLDPKTKTLIKAGYMTNDLTLTGRGKAALDAIVASEHADALVAAAQEDLDEEKA